MNKTSSGKIVLGALAPHPPHLIYAENPTQNEPRSEGGWEGLRWGYERLRQNLDAIDYDVIIVHSPHWRTVTGTHFLGLPHFRGLSVDPVFPNLFRYSYDVDIDVELSKALYAETHALGLPCKLMTNPDFRIDYGTLVSAHMSHPQWTKPLVVISSPFDARYFSFDVLQNHMLKVGEATRTAIVKTGRRAVLLASASLSHRHFVVEPDPPEDMSREHIYHHGQYVWDMRILDLMRRGRSREILAVLPDFTEQTVAETDSGGLSWLLSAMEFPTVPAKVHAYGSVIGTGNAIVEWPLEKV